MSSGPRIYGAGNDISDHGHASFDYRGGRLARLPVESLLYASVQDVSRSGAGRSQMNVGSLGNIVQQLHIHVVARFEGDKAWPGPIWGACPSVPYEKEAFDELAERIKIKLGEN